MEALFVNILNMSFNAGIVILAVLIFRCLLKRVPKIFSYCLWGVVLFRLLCPVSFQAEWSLVGVISKMVPWQCEAEYVLSNVADMEVDSGWLEKEPDETELTADNFLQENFMTVGSDFSETEIESEEAWQEETVSDRHSFLLSRKLQNIVSVCKWIWAAGIMGMFMYSAISLMKLKRNLKGAAWEKDNIYITESIQTPFVIGLWKPRIYLPALLEEKEKEYILLHEQVHIRRGDHLIKAVSFLTLCLHWFNPLVWVAFVFCEKDMEMSCDEAVIRKLGTDVKKEYSGSLLKLAVGKAVISGAPLGFGEGDTKGRIKNILKYRKTATWILCIAGVVSIFAVLFLGLNPKDVSASEDYTQDRNELVTEEEKRNGADVETVEMPVTEVEQSEGDVQDSKEAENGENEFLVNVRTIAEEERYIDSYVWADESMDDEADKKLFFSDDCDFFINKSMISKNAYIRADFEEFADLINAGDPYMNKPCILTIEDGIVVEAKLNNAYYQYGISYSVKPETDGWYETVLAQTGGIEKYYTLADTVYMDVADRSGTEKIEIYTRNIGDGDSGLLMVYASDGELLYTEGAHTARAGWNNIYLGKKDGVNYIMTVHIDDRDTSACCDYQVFRFGIDGEVELLAGSSFSTGDTYTYDEELYEEWLSCMEYYWQEASSMALVLSTQDGVLRTREIGGNEDYSNDEGLLYNSVLQELTEEQSYAFVDIGAKYPVLLVTDMTYDYLDGIKAAIDSEVYYVWDGKAVNLGIIESMGTAYPISYDKNSIYVAGGHFVARYALDEEERSLYIAEAGNVVYDEEGNETYNYGTNGEMEEVSDGKLLNDELTEKYALATVVNFEQ